MDGGAVRRTRRALAIRGAALLLSLLGFAGLQPPTGADAANTSPYRFSIWGYHTRVTASGVKWVRLQWGLLTIDTWLGVCDLSCRLILPLGRLLLVVHLPFPI